MSVVIKTSRSAISKDLGATVISGHFLVYNEKRKKKNVYEAVKSVVFSSWNLSVFEMVWKYLLVRDWWISFLSLFLYINIKSIPWSFYNNFVIGELRAYYLRIF